MHGIFLICSLTIYWKEALICFAHCRCLVIDFCWKIIWNFIVIKCISNLCVSHPQKRSCTEREEFYSHTFEIIRVIDIGRLQIIFCFHPSCRCNFHLDRKFFMDFHHVTRYRLLVYHKKSDNGQLYDLWFTVYIPYAKELGLITETIQIDKNAIKNYPKKHADYMIRTSPPTLYHQCQNVLLESTYCKTAKQDMKTGKLTCSFHNYCIRCYFNNHRQVGWDILPEDEDWFWC